MILFTGFTCICFAGMDQENKTMGHVSIRQFLKYIYIWNLLHVSSVHGTTFKGFKSNTTQTNDMLIHIN